MEKSYKVSNMLEASVLKSLQRLQKCKNCFVGYVAMHAVKQTFATPYLKTWNQQFRRVKD